MSSNEVKIFFETDSESTQYQFTKDTNGMRGLGELVFAALERHATYVMISPDNLEEIAEDNDD
jgi:hypothetical protein